MFSGPISSKYRAADTGSYYLIYAEEIATSGEPCGTTCVIKLYRKDNSFKPKL